METILVWLSYAVRHMPQPTMVQPDWQFNQEGVDHPIRHRGAVPNLGCAPVSCAIRANGVKRAWQLRSRCCQSEGNCHRALRPIAHGPPSRPGRYGPQRSVIRIVPPGNGSSCASPDRRPFRNSASALGLVSLLRSTQFPTTSNSISVPIKQRKHLRVNTPAAPHDVEARVDVPRGTQSFCGTRISVDDRAGLFPCGRVGTRAE